MPVPGKFIFPMIGVETGGGEIPPGYIDTNDPEALNTACVVGGYIPDPAAYIPDPILNDIILPSEGKIRLVVEDAGLRQISFSATISNSGKFQATVIGDGNIQLDQKTYTNNTAATLMLPTSPGFLSNYGIRYYYVDITSELPTNVITFFKTSVNTAYDELGGYIVAVFINAPTITSLFQSFYNMKRIRHIEFLCDMPVLTNLSYSMNSASSLRRLIFKELPEVVTMQSMLYQTNYVNITFPSSMPKLTSTVGMYALSKNADVVWNFEAPFLADANNCFYQAEIRSLSFIPVSFPELTNIATFCKNVVGLKGIVNYPLMPKLTTMANAHENNFTVEEIKFNGVMDSLTSWFSLAINCYALKKLTLPESILGMTTIQTSTSSKVVDNCNSLEELVLPKRWAITINNTTGIFFYHFPGCSKLRTISTIEQTNGFQLGLLNGANLLSLERFDQPNAFWATSSNYSISFAKAVGITGKLEYLEMDWNASPKIGIDVIRNNFSFTEVRRILASINPLKSTSIHNFAISGNPLIDAHILYEATSSGGNHVFTMPLANYNSNIVKVGASWYAQQNTKNGAPILIKADNTFTLGTSWTRAPLNGVKMVVPTNLYSSYGMTPYKTFYVVNSQEGSGNIFQLSETLGGQPYAFNFGAELLNTSITVLASCHVTNISVGATFVTVNISFPYYPNSGSRQGTFCNPDEFDWWEMAERGYVIP